MVWCSLLCALLPPCTAGVLADVYVGAPPDTRTSMVRLVSHWEQGGGCFIGGNAVVSFIQTTFTGNEAVSTQQGACTVPCQTLCSMISVGAAAWWDPLFWWAHIQPEWCGSLCARCCVCCCPPCTAWSDIRAGTATPRAWLSAPGGTWRLGGALCWAPMAGCAVDLASPVGT